MTEQWNKVWFDGDKVVTQEIPLEALYKRVWVGLTHEQRVDLLAAFEKHKHEWHAHAILIAMVEAAHNIKVIK